MKTETRSDPWKEAHREALDWPRSDHEAAIGLMYRGLMAYPPAHKERFDSLLGEDYVLGPAWIKAARGFLALLNGETGRLDCGTMDGAIRDIAREHELRLDDE